MRRKLLDRSTRCPRARAALAAERRRPSASGGPLETMPSGAGAAAEAFAWLNRQLTWQALLADLESLTRRTN